MTELDRASLDHLLPATPGPADWDDVLNRSGAHQRRRRRLVAVAATALVVAVGTGSAIGGVRDFVLRTGFIGLPPIGATPSSPASGELEIWYWAFWAANGQSLWAGPANPNVKGGRTRAWVYADGRLITWDGPDRPGSANPLSTGFLEQRLTPEGVERLRSEIAAAGDFGDLDELAPPSFTVPKPAPDGSITVPFFTPIVVKGLGTLVRVDHARDLDPIVRATLGSGIAAPSERVGGERRQSVRGVEVRRLLWGRAARPARRTVPHLGAAAGRGQRPARGRLAEAGPALRRARQLPSLVRVLL